MVARTHRVDCDDESSVCLLHKHSSRSNSDLGYFLKQPATPFAPQAKQSHKSSFFQRLQCALLRGKNKKPTRNQSSEDSAPETVALSIDNRDMSFTAESDVRDGPAQDAISTVSSQLTTSTYNKRQRTLLTHWKTRMSKGICKILRTDKREEPADPDLFVYPPHALYAISRRRPAESVYHELRVPSLDSIASPRQSTDEVSTRAGYSTEGADFPLESYCHVENEGIELELDSRGQVLTRSVSLLSLVQPKDSTVSVAFDHTCAQLVFMPTHSYVDDGGEDDAFDVDAYQTDARSKNSEDDDDTHFTDYLRQPQIVSTDWEDDDTTDYSDSDRKPMGATYSHPSALLSTATSEETEEEALGIACPPWNSTATSTTINQDDRELWSHVEQPDDEDELTEPPTPTVVEKTNLWCGLGQTLGWSGSEDSDLTMSAFVGNDIPRLPKFPMWKQTRDDHPFDELADYGKRKVPLVTAHEERKVHFEKMANGFQKRATMSQRPSTTQPAYSSILSQRFENLVLTTLGHREVDLDDDDEDSYFSRRSAGRQSHKHQPKCFCVKCAAKGIYEDLIKGP